MASDQYISVREAAQHLGVSEKRIMDLIEEEQLTAYRIANQFLRLKKTDVLKLQTSGSVEPESVQQPYTWNEKLLDFFYFNDFYMVCAIIIAILIYIIVHG